MTTNQPTPVIDDEALAEIEATAEALKGVPDACDITHAKPEFVNYVLKCNPAAISALCRTLRAAWTENEQLQAQIEKLVDECGNWRARAEDLAGHALEDDE